MGASKRKRERFFDLHRWCCFCGGSTPTTTIDHVPNRACFLGRAYPETFEFPACDACQNASRLDEIVFSHAVTLTDFNPNNLNEARTRKAIEGLINNLPPEYWPNPHTSASVKRQIWKSMGFERPAGTFASDLPVVRLSKEFGDSVLRYACKIAVALYYREAAAPASLDFQVTASWSQAADVKNHAHIERLAGMLPNLTKGTRSNLDFGDQFRYKSFVTEDCCIAAFLIQFGAGVILSTTLIAPGAATIPDHVPRIAVGKMFEGSPELGGMAKSGTAPAIA